MSELIAPALVVLWIIVAVQTLLLVGTLRQLGMIQLRLGTDPGALITSQGLERDSLAPDIEASDAVDGTRLKLSDLKGRRVLMFFLTPTCIACKELVPHINAVAKEWPQLAMIAICHGTAGATAEFARSYRLKVPIIADEDNRVGEIYDVRFTPFTYLLDESGRVRIRGVANNWPQLEALIEEEGTFGYRPPSAHREAGQPTVLPTSVTAK